MATNFDWADHLRRNDELNAWLELQWLSDADRDALRSDWLATWNDVPFDEVFHRECRERLTRCVPLATGPSRARRLTHTSSELTLVADPDEPDTVFVSLSHAFPSLLWSRAEPNHESIRTTVAPYLSDAMKQPGEFSRVVRVAKTPGLEDRAPIEQSVEYLELWLDDAFWYSGFVDDPWAAQEGPLNMIQQSAWLRDVSEEHPGRFPSVSWRSLWSKSILKVEQHVLGIFVFELRYEPATDGAVIEYINEVVGGHLPLDVPVDLAASLLRGGIIDDVALDDMEARGESLYDRLAFRCALEPGETTTYDALRRAATDHADDPELLGFVVDLAADYRHDALWFEIVAENKGTALAEELRHYLAPSFGEGDAQ